tara:strand:- start:1191 stop:1448 length:258 start_codon:yes stop_codon:yes gene_type:complete
MHFDLNACAYHPFLLVAGLAQALRWAWPLALVLMLAAAHACVVRRSRLLPLLGWLFLTTAAACFVADGSACAEVEAALLTPPTPP